MLIKTKSFEVLSGRVPNTSTMDGPYMWNSDYLAREKYLEENYFDKDAEALLEDARAKCEVKVSIDSHEKAQKMSYIDVIQITSPVPVEWNGDPMEWCESVYRRMWTMLMLQVYDRINERYEKSVNIYITNSFVKRRWLGNEKRFLEVSCLIRR